MDPVYSSMNYLARGVAWLPKQLYNSIPPTTYSKSIPSGVTAEAVFDIVKLNLRPYIRIAGLTGCLALVAAAYGSHGKLPLNLPSKTTFEKDAVFIADRNSASFKEIFERANKQQFFTAFALTGVAFTKFPALTATLFLVGNLIFSGSCYYYALTGNSRFYWITPYGGIMQIIAWLSMAL